uniref:50S ribosomal protein L9, chloroplastic n=1 Tax=Leptosiphonia brodiei TaxID=2608611 RepID=A0A1Z1MA75_9FLOR|nr:ribosomal protein L9 [Leptosiphonia brodiei]ARW62988.1 ribosomal protein L9 [Leptosiphonia brodiei]
MKKKIQIILNNETESLVSVSRGYAFNYLIPKGKATIPTKKKIKHLKMFHRINKEKQKIDEIRIKTVSKNLEEINKISIRKKRGESNLIFGSITDKEILKWLLQHTNLQIVKNQIKINNMKTIGKTNFNINLKENLNKELQLNIIPANI